MPDEKDGQDPTRNPDAQSFSPAPPEATIEQRIMALEAQIASQKKEEPAAQLLGDVKTGEWWLIGINGLLLIATVVIACIYYGQLGQMRIATGLTDAAVKVASSTLTETQNSNARQALLTDKARISSEKTANDALQATIDTFHQDQRAWVSIKNARLTKPFSTTEKAQVTVLVTNSGHTPGLKMYFSCRGMKLDAEPTCDPHLGKGEVFKSPVPPGGETEQFLLIDPQSQALIDGLKNNTHIFYLKFGLEYQDINGKVHHTTFCGSYPTDHEPFLMGCPNGGSMD
jgi:hypothetical protein